MPPIKFAVVGIGGFGRTHLNALAHLQAEGLAHLDAVVVIDPENHPEQLQEYRKTGVRIFNTLDDLLHAGGVDWITLPVGIHHHAPLTIACLEAGFNVLCEKPLAATVQDANRVIDTKNKTGKTVLIGYQSIYTPAIQTVKSRLLEGRLGKIRNIRIKGGWPRSDAYYARNTWAGKLKQGTTWILDSPINNAFAHDVNNAFYLCGPSQHESAAPTAVQAELYRARTIETFDTACLRAHTANHTDILITLSHVTREYSDPQMVLTCEKGTVRWSRDNALIHYADGTQETFDQIDTRDNDHPFLNAVKISQEGAPPLCPPELARAQTLCINAAHESCPTITNFPPNLVETAPLENSSVHIVQGLDALMDRSFREGKLFSELGIPWAQPTKPFDLTGYNSYPNAQK